MYFVSLRLLLVLSGVLTLGCPWGEPQPLPEPEPVLEIAEVPQDLPKYDRGDWGRWIDADGDCQDTRQEVLIAEGSEISYTDDRQCRVATGKWVGPYTGEVFTDPGDLDVDHMVPLANAHRSGAWEWTDAKRREFFNDLSAPEHLIAVKARANRSKGARGPEYWKPPLESYHCQYATDWIQIKTAWSLTATQAEADALDEMLDTC